MTPNVFTLLGVHPILGQLFETRETSWTDGSGRIPILISENFWRRRSPGIRHIGNQIEDQPREASSSASCRVTFAFRRRRGPLYPRDSSRQTAAARVGLFDGDLPPARFCRPSTPRRTERADPCCRSASPAITNEMPAQPSARKRGTNSRPPRWPRSSPTRYPGCIGRGRSAHRDDQCRQFVSPQAERASQESPSLTPARLALHARAAFVIEGSSRRCVGDRRAPPRLSHCPEFGFTERAGSASS